MLETVLNRRTMTCATFAIVAAVATTSAHDLAGEERFAHHRRVASTATWSAQANQVATTVTGKPAQAASFEAFAPKVKVRWDDEFLYVENNGLPAHGMMQGITAWQQQVPLPQSYFGDNAWRIPLHPVIAKQAISIKGRFLRGAIALAANGIPIFNPQNNRGEVSQMIGELDQWGGHCGRADDYHYHAAPLHLQTVLGKGKPIAYALDGYPIYGLTEPDGTPTGKLDECDGHATTALGYHYHASLKYPFLNGGFHGEVVEREGQVDPQPRAIPVRPDLPPLRGAHITHFTVSPDEKQFSLQYTAGGKTSSVNYSSIGDGSWKFQFVGTDGEKREQTYRAGERSKTPRDDSRPLRETPASVHLPTMVSPNIGSFILKSPEVAAGEALPVEYTGDGTSSTLPLEWTGAPAGTQCFALIMHHLDPEGITKVYWTLYNIPANVKALPKNTKGIGTLGTNTINDRIGYAPPHSKGPGAKTYVFTLYALSAAPQIRAQGVGVSGEMLAAAIKDITLASTDLSVVYTRGGASAPPNQKPPSSAPPRDSASFRPDAAGLVKPEISDIIKVNVYADNWFILYINGKPVAVDPIDFLPHNVVSVDILPEYPMTIAVMAKDNADPQTGMEYGNHIGDGGFIIKFADGTLSNASWKVKSFFNGPLNHDATHPKAEHTPIPADWFCVNFDDSTWRHATEFTEQQVHPKPAFYTADFKGAKFIWSTDLDLDNTVIFRTLVEKPGWKPRWNTKPDLDVRATPLR